MRAPKQGDSPSGYPRDVTQLRRVQQHEDLNDLSLRVKARARKLIAANPHLVGDVRGLYSRMITPETAPDYESALNRTAWGLLLVVAIEHAARLDITSGDAA